MFQPDLLKGKRILVTGGGTGLGLSMGRRFLELGADLVICGRREHVLADAAAKLKAETKATIETHGCDIRDAQAVEAMFDSIWQKRPLDALHPPQPLRQLLASYVQPYRGGTARVFDPYFRYFRDDPAPSVIWWFVFAGQVLQASRHLGK